MYGVASIPAAISVVLCAIETVLYIGYVKWYYVLGPECGSKTE